MITGNLVRHDLLIVLEEELVRVLLRPSVSVTVIFIPEENSTGGTAMMKVVGVDFESWTPSPQSRVT